MLYLIDGYNVTRSDPATRELSLEDQREALIRRLRARGVQMLGPGRIVILFDARDAAFGQRVDAGPVEVHYARSGSADDAIVKAVSGVSGKVVVVSNDRELADRARVHAQGGIEVRPASAAYESAGLGSDRRGKRPRPPRDTGLPAGANKITEELKKLWLSESEEE